MNPDTLTLIRCIGGWATNIILIGMLIGGLWLAMKVGKHDDHQ